MQQVRIALLLQQIAATVREGDVSVREEKPNVGALDNPAGAASGAGVGADGHHQQHESGAGRIHDSADVKQTLVLERPSWLSAA